MQLSKTATAPSTKEFASLGKFVGACSLIEISLHSLLRKWLGIDEWVVRGLVGEPRSGDLIAHLKFAYAHHKPYGENKEIADRLQHLYEQAGYLNDVRSVVAHKPFFTDEGILRFHNTFTAKRKAGEWEYRCSATQLTNAAWYAIQVAARFIAASSVGMSDPARYVLECNELESSRQILDLPRRPGPNSPAPTPKPKRRQQSSREKSQSKEQK